MPLKSMEIEGMITNSSASVSFTQVYKNETESPIECVYKFPTDPSFVVAGLHVEVGDKIIDAEVMEKKQAEQKYDDAVAAGHTAVKLSQDNKLPDIIELNIGAMQPSAEARITIRILSELEVIRIGFYTFVFPIEFIPRYGDTDGTYGQGGSLMPAGIDMQFKICANSVITNLCVSHDGMEYVQSEDGKMVELKLSSDEPITSKDLVISYSSEHIRQPQLSIFRSDKYPGKLAAHISFIPRSSEECENEGKSSFIFCNSDMFLNRTRRNQRREQGK